MIKIMREKTLKRKLEESENIGFSNAIREVRLILQQKEKIEKMYFDPVKLFGVGQTNIKDCVFLGSPSPQLEILPLVKPSDGEGHEH